MDSLRRLTMLARKQLLVDMFPILGRWDLQGWYEDVMYIIEEDLGGVWKDSLETKRKGGSNISSSRKDFTDVMIEKGFSNQQINPLMQELFAAGTESTSSIIECFLEELLENQDVMQKARDEVMNRIDGNVVQMSDLVHLPFLEACYKETLRLHPPGTLTIPHKAIQSCEVMGYTIPKDSQILVNIWAINHDPDIGNDPLSFKPERFVGSKLSFKGKDFEYLPFGSGRRMCPAEPLVSKTVLLIIASLIQNFDWFLPNNRIPIEKGPVHINFKLREFKN